MTDLPFSHEEIDLVWGTTEYSKECDEMFTRLCPRICDTVDFCARFGFPDDESADAATRKFLDNYYGKS